MVRPVSDTILDAIGNTPMVRINRITADQVKATVLAKVETIMQPAFPFVDISTPVDALSTMITPDNPAVLVRDFKSDKTFIITRSDVIRVLC